MAPLTTKLSVGIELHYFQYIYISCRFVSLVYFESLDVNNDGIISREDLEACLPHTVESQQIIQQLLRQWDMVNSCKRNEFKVESYVFFSRTEMVTSV